ncbi:MAG: TonB-dependent receptor [Arenicella sp.]
MKLTKLYLAMAGLPLMANPYMTYANENEGAEKTVRLDNILVIGENTQVTTEKLAGSYDVVSRDELDYEHPDDTYELFDKAPGVYFARYNQGIINTDVAIRGFAGDGVTPHAKLLIDGVPFNLNNGYGELDQLFPLDIESIELYKGNSDARYGLFNLAGNYNVSSRRDIAKELKITLGSFSTSEVQGYAGLESGNLTHNYFLGYRQGNGYRDHTDIEKLEASGKWFYNVNDNSEIGLSIRHSTYEADSPGYLTQEEARNNPTSSASYASEDGGDKTINHYSVHYNTTLSDSVEWSNKLYYNDIERSRWVRFFESSTLQNRFDDQQQTGFISTIDWTINAQWAVELGADLQQQDVLEQRFNHPEQTRASARTVNRNREYTLDSTGVFATVEQTPSDLLRWNLGVRLDRLDGERLDNGGDIFDFGTIVQPKANLFITPNDDLTVFANYGRSFQHPVGSAIYTTTDRGATDVSLHDAWEFGAKWFATANTELRVSYWQHEAEDEFLDLDGFQQIVGDTERNGIDLGLNITASNKAKVWFNYSYLSSEIVDPVSDREATLGNELRSVPEYTASVGFDYEVTSKLTSRVHVDSQGDYYVNENNQGGKFGGYTTVNVGLDYEASIGHFNFQVNNIFDEEYEYVYDFGNTGDLTVHSPGDGVNASVTYSYKF